MGGRLSKGFLFAFIGIAAVAVTGVDYANQARVTGAGLGGLGLSGYAHSIRQRYGDYHAELERDAARHALLVQDRRELLPAAPEGWTRHGWGDEDEVFFGTNREVELPPELKKEPMLANLLELDRKAGRRQREGASYVYEKGDNRIVMLAHFDPNAGKGAGIAGPFMALAQNNIEAMSGKTGFAIVHGVTFRQDLGLFGGAMAQADSSEADPARTFRSFSASLNKEVNIRVNARASDDAIYQLLSAIDFDQLNIVLDEPIPGIGKAAPEVPWEQQKAAADANVRADAVRQMAETIDANARLQEWAKDVTARHKGAAPTEAEYEAETIGAVGQMIKAGEAAAPAQAAEGAGGLFGRIAGMFGGGGSAETADASAAAAPAKPGTFGTGACTMSGAAKRCSLTD